MTTTLTRPWTETNHKIVAGHIVEATPERCALRDAHRVTKASPWLSLFVIASFLALAGLGVWG